jgi:hypothetical protein
MFKKILFWTMWGLFASFCLFFLSAAASGFFVFGRAYLHGFIEGLADIIMWFWSLHWSILISIFIVLGVYSLFLINQRDNRMNKRGD